MKYAIWDKNQSNFAKMGFTKFIEGSIAAGLS